MPRPSWGEVFVSCLANGCVTFAAAAAAILKAPGDKGENRSLREACRVWPRKVGLWGAGPELTPPLGTGKYLPIFRESSTVVQGGGGEGERYHLIARLVARERTACRGSWTPSFGEWVPGPFRDTHTYTGGATFSPPLGRSFILHVENSACPVK